MRNTKAVLAIMGSLSTLLLMSLHARFSAAQSSTVPSRAETKSSQIQIAQTQVSNPSCDAATAQMYASLTEGRQLDISSQFTRETADVYTNYPAGRTILYTLFIEGAASASVMNSPQFLRNISGSFFDECDIAGAISIVDLNSIAGVKTIGLINGQPMFFECIQGIATTRISWGYHDCSP